MADGEKAGSILLWRTNVSKFLRWVGFTKRFGPESKPEKMGSYQNLANLFNGKFFESIGILNKEMVQTDLDWDGLEGAGGEGSASYLMDKVVELYSDFTYPNHEIQSSIGPFVNADSISREHNYADKGSGLNPDGRTYTFDEKPFNINLKTSGGQPIYVKFNIPPDREIVHNSYSYRVAYFGSREGGYWPQLQMDINGICNAAKVHLQNRPDLSDDEKKQVVENINSINQKFTNIRKYLEKMMEGFENEIRSALEGAGSGLGMKHTGLKRLRTRVIERALTSEMVHYTHTYKVINVNLKGELLNPDGTVARDENGNPRSLPESFRQGKEMAPGLDEHGWPLEVGDGTTVFEGSTMPLGRVVLDIYDGHSPNGGTPRDVPANFTRDCDLLDVTAWMYASWDARRDDLRDGRHHECITVMDRIMTELEIKGHPQTMKRIEAGKQAGDSEIDSEKIKMRLNKLPAGSTEQSYRPASDPDFVEITMKPTHINPAFDMRATAKDKHMGRRLYYDVQENVVKSKKPTITSRGAALYILHRVIEETKYWGGGMSPGKAGVMEVLEAIGNKISGYDIGPNMELKIEVDANGEIKDVKRPGWGRSLPTNPFKPRV